MAKKVFLGVVNNGEIYFDDKHGYVSMLEKENGKKIRVVLDTTKPRTVKQNSLMWCMYKFLEENEGSNSMDYFHNYFKVLFLGSVNNPEIKGIIEKMTEDEIEACSWIYTTRNMDTAKFTLYIDSIYKWALEKWKIEIPTADQFKKMSEDHDTLMHGRQFR